MEQENEQENVENAAATVKIEEVKPVIVVVEPQQQQQEPILEKTESMEETEESVSLEQTEETEDQENHEDFNSARSRSDTECTDDSRGTDAEEDEEGEEDDDEEEEDDASVVLEREEGDGQESTPNRKVDDDEDKRNPQYIPKKGTFYEHDDRTAADEGEEEVKEQPDEEKSEKDASTGKKKVWSEKEANKWSHDRFVDQEQAPKSRQELISIYGYDIRNEEGPPRARRRRRYGRGPNKYTRNWEDEDAYSKPTNVSAKPVPRKPRKPGQEEFPPLNPEHQENSGNPENHPRDESKSPDARESGQHHQQQQDVKENVEQENKLQKQDDNHQVKDQQHPDEQELEILESYASQYSYGGRKGGYRGGGRNAGNTTTPRMDHHHSSNRGILKTRGGGRGVDSTRFRNQRNNQQQKPRMGDDQHSDYILSQNFTNKSMGAGGGHHEQNVRKLEKDMANMTVQQTGNEGPSNKPSYKGTTTTRGGKYTNSGNSGGGNRQTSVPPRLQQQQQQEPRGSKRYSSLRQRSLPETAGGNFGPQPSYFQQQEYPQQSTTQPQSQAGLLPHPQVTATTTPQLITVAPPSANGAPLMQAPPPQFAQPPPYAQPPPAFMQPPVAPPGVTPFIPQQAPPPQILNYGQPQFHPQFPPPPHQHQHQHQQFNPVNQGPPQPPAELYQPQGGITYYSTQNQQLLPRAPPKRVKSAIPIVPPPEHKEPRGRGRTNQCEDGGGGGGGSPGGDFTPDVVVVSAGDYEQNCEFTADAVVTIQQ